MQSEHLLKRGHSYSFNLTISPALRRHFGGRSRCLSNHVTTGFCRHRDSVGLGRATYFHSFRRTVATIFENAGFSGDGAVRFLGQETVQFSFDVYSDGPAAARIVDALRAIQSSCSIQRAAKSWIETTANTVKV